MHTIKTDITHEIVVDKSKFICYLKRILTVEDAIEKINQIKKIHYNANHHCMAFVIDNQVRSSDDGEPQGSAGLPLLNVLLNNDLNEVLVVVVRYFGGIKLGVGGLKRAYSKALIEALNQTTTLSLVKMDEIKITTNYHYGNLIISKVTELLQNKYYGENVELYYLINPKTKDLFLAKVQELTNNNFSFELLGTTMYEKEDE